MILIVRLSEFDPLMDDLKMSCYVLCRFVTLTTKLFLYIKLFRNQTIYVAALLFIAKSQIKAQTLRTLSHHNIMLK